MCNNSWILKTGVRLVLVIAVLATVSASTALSQEFRKVPVVLHAPDILPRELLTGPNYTVNTVVMSDGLVNTYQLETFYGPLKVESTLLLLKRINDLKAIHRIGQLKQTDVYGNAFKQAVSAPLDTAAGLIC